jgi:hypothetical protein
MSGYANESATIVLKFSRVRVSHIEQPSRFDAQQEAMRKKNGQRKKEVRWYDQISNNHKASFTL